MNLLLSGVSLYYDVSKLREVSRPTSLLLLGERGLQELAETVRSSAPDGLRVGVRLPVFVYSRGTPS